MIQFFSEEIEFSLPETNSLSEHLLNVASNENKVIECINYIFCSDVYLHKINIEYLDHDTYTDIITFDQSEEEGIIIADIFISIDRVKDNANDHAVDFITELYRVLSHGLFHLIGYGDKTDEEKKLMREKEDEFLSLCGRNGL